MNICVYMNNNERFVEIGKNKAIIKKLQSEVNAYEKENLLTFEDDVKNFFLVKGYEFDTADRYKNKFINLREVDDKNTFKPYSKPYYYITGKNKLIIRFEWSLKKNSNVSKIYWYPEKRTLEDFYEKRLKKVLILPLTVERKNKLKKLKTS